jgi:hypothetical protein
VEEACETVGVGQSAVSGQRSAVRIYPNPASSSIIVESDELLPNSYFTLYNFHGQEVLHQRITEENTIIDISRLPSGLYFYHTWTMDNGQPATGKLVKL